MTLEEQRNEFELLCNQAKEVLLKKGNDYATIDRLSNFKDAGKIVGITPQQHCLALIATKVSRLGNLLQPNTTPCNEAVEDSMLDLFVYSALLNMINKESIKDLPTDTELPF